MNERKITATYNPTPMPKREFDWCATFDDYEPGYPMGYGATKEDAIKDLLAKSEEGRRSPRSRERLAPCPFCGCDQLKISPNMSSGLLRVQCEGCWATSITSNQRATIIAAWNRRATPQAEASRSDVLEAGGEKDGAASLRSGETEAKPSAFDEECLKLAKYFLQDVPCHTDAQASELAGAIQQTIEDWLPGIEEDVAEERRNNGALGVGA